MPNWSDGAVSITSTTASNYVSSNPNCSFASGWTFQWGYGDVTNPGDNTGAADAATGWTSFGPTNGSGQATVDIQLEESGTIKVREAWQSAYVPFSQTFQDDESAEMWCHADVSNYDNYDFIWNPDMGGTYYCVAFNALEEQAECGNGIVEEGEECDDGNNDNNDFCSNNCEHRTPICHATASETHPYNVLWVPDDAIDGEGQSDHRHHEDDIIPITDLNNDGDIDEDDCDKYDDVCGDGDLDPGEECDDGNDDDDDGCSNECTIPNSCDDTCTTEFGCANDLVCAGGSCRNNQCTTEGDCICPACGDGTVDPGEECDDGNNTDGDGCSAQCTIPNSCDSTCTAEFGCANGLVCSDGSCRNSQCTTEGDCICPACGDGTVDPGEECDDGNNTDGDGCSSSCTIPNSCNSTCTDDFGCGNGLTCSNGACRN
ncbi:MAG: DUF4215 domain-containing protein, partial [Candidatus Kerfeldbacteria bacterium]